MPRDVPVGNGSLLVCFDQHYQIRELYWPYVGLENHVAGYTQRYAASTQVGQDAWIWDGQTTQALTLTDGSAHTPLRSEIGLNTRSPTAIANKYEGIGCGMRKE